MLRSFACIGDRFGSAFLIGVLLAGLPAAAQAQEDAKKWQPLFNGKDLSGWTDIFDNSSEWQVANGVLQGRGGGRGNPAVLLSDGEYSNFRLRLAFRYGPNPGGGVIEVRRSGENDITSTYAVSTCVQPFWLVKSRPTGNIIKVKNYRYGSPGVPDRPSKQIKAGVNQWHTLEIVANANRITSFVNGQMADDYVDSKKSYASGNIALTCWGDSTVQIRDVQILPLPE